MGCDADGVLTLVVARGFISGAGANLFCCGVLQCGFFCSAHSHLTGVQPELTRTPRDGRW